MLNHVAVSIYSWKHAISLTHPVTYCTIIFVFIHCTFDSGFCLVVHSVAL